LGEGANDRGALGLGDSGSGASGEAGVGHAAGTADGRGSGTAEGAEATTDPGIGQQGTLFSELLAAGRERSAGRRGPILAGAVAVVLVLLVGAVVLLMDTGGGKRHQAAVKPPASQVASKPPSASASPSATALTVPDGFRLYKDPDGAAAAIPKSWSDPSRWDNGSMHSSSPDGQSRIEFYGRSGSGSALDELRGQGESDHSQYAEVKAPAPVTAGRFTDPTGAKVAEMEYTWQSNSGKMHVLVRDMVIGGHVHELLIQGPAGSWDPLMKELAPVLQSYGPTP